MGRPELPVVRTSEPLYRLAMWLRSIRLGAGNPGYRELAERTGFHATTLQRAAAGREVPRLAVVRAYAEACLGSSVAVAVKADQLWKRARYSQTRARGMGGVPPRPRMVRDIADLSAALVDLYHQAGSPSTRALEEKAGGYGVLPRSSAHRIITKQAVPHSLQQLKGFLLACDVFEDNHSQWEEAWTRARRNDRQVKERASWPQHYEPDIRIGESTVIVVQPESRILAEVETRRVDPLTRLVRRRAPVRGAQEAFRELDRFYQSESYRIAAEGLHSGY